MSRGLLDFCERRVTLLIMVILASGFHIVQPDMSPVPGAWVGTLGEWTGAADAEGFFQLSDTLPDTIRIHSTGFADWAGPLPEPGDSVVLNPIVLNTGATITVLASRGSLGDMVPSTTVLEEEELSHISSLGMERLGSSVPGVTVREYGGSMPVVSVSLRGGDPAQADYMVDGVSIVSARDGMPTGIFDPGIFSSLEVSRGGASPGGQGTGSSGTLNWLPPAGNLPSKVIVSGFSDGSFGALSRFSRTGISFKRTIGTQGSQGFASSIVTTFTGGVFSGGILAGWAKGDTESPDWTLPGDGNREQRQAEGWITWAPGSFEVDLSTGSGYMKQIASEPYLINDIHKDFTGRLSVAWKGPLTFRAAMESTSLNSTATGSHRENFGTLEGEFNHGIFSAFIGCRLDENGAAPSARTNLKGALPLQGMAYHLSFFTDHRTPTVNDLYWPFDGMTMGDPDLKSERSTGIEAGSRWSGQGISAGLCGFVTYSSDLIIWLPGDEGIWSPSNISSSLSRGMEAEASASLGNLSLSGNFTWNLAEDRTEGTIRYGMLIPYRPEYFWNASAIVDLPLQSSLRVDISGTGKRFTNRTQTEYLDQYTLLDLSTSTEISQGVSVTISAGNVLDSEYFAGSGYPGRGRTAGLTIEYTGK